VGSCLTFAYAVVANRIGHVSAHVICITRNGETSGRINRHAMWNSLMPLNTSNARLAIRPGKSIYALAGALSSRCGNSSRMGAIQMDFLDGAVVVIKSISSDFEIVHVCSNENLGCRDIQIRERNGLNPSVVWRII